MAAFCWVLNEWTTINKKQRCIMIYRTSLEAKIDVPPLPSPANIVLGEYMLQRNVFGVGADE
jgi:hypothetical protein